MTELQSQQTVETPRHIWVVGVVTFLWNSMGAMDYVMTKTRNEEYMSAFTPEQLTFFYSFSVWTTGAWAIAVWGGVLGSLLLLLRKSSAVGVLLASFVAMVVTLFHNFVLSNGMDVIGGIFSLVFSAIIFIVALGLYLYARAMHQQGILK